MKKFAPTDKQNRTRKNTAITQVLGAPATRIFNHISKVVFALILTFFVQSSSAKSFVDEIADAVGDRPDVNINLGTGIINTILALTDDKDAKEARKVLAGLDKIRVSIFELNGKNDSVKLNKIIKKKINALMSKGYESIVTVREKHETVHIIAKVKDQLLEDAMLVVMEENDELVLITMEGTLDLKQLAEVSKHFDVDIASSLNY